MKKGDHMRENQETEVKREGNRDNEKDRPQREAESETTSNHIKLTKQESKRKKIRNKNKDKIKSQTATQYPKQSGNHRHTRAGPRHRDRARVIEWPANSVRTSGNQQTRTHALARLTLARSWRRRRRMRPRLALERRPPPSASVSEWDQIARCRQEGQLLLPGNQLVESAPSALSLLLGLGENS